MKQITQIPKLHLTGGHEVLAATEGVLLLLLCKGPFGPQEYVVYNYYDGACYTGFYTENEAYAQAEFMRRAFSVELPDSIPEPGEYFKHGGLQCYFCHSSNIASVDDIEDMSPTLIMQVECEDCGETWKDVYTLTDVELEEICEA